jgi:Kef-type K+ transport system membrane component KefB
MNLSPMVVFAVILFVGTCVSYISKRFRITAVPMFLVIGIIMSGLGVESHEGLSFVGDLGLIMIVFIAGLGVYKEKMVSVGNMTLFCVLNAATSFAAGVFIGYIFEYGIYASMLIGTILISSSVGIIIPMIAEKGELKSRYGFLTPSVVVLDGLSLFLLAFIIEMSAGEGVAGFLAYSAIFIVLMLIFLPRIARRFFFKNSRKAYDLPFVFMCLTGFIAVAEVIGLPNILIAFLAGISLGETVLSREVYDEVKAIGEDFLMPVFFVVLGMELNFGVFAESLGSIVFTISLILALMLSKVITGFAFGKIRGYGSRESLLIGAIFWPQLDATLAATAVAFDAGLFDGVIVVAVACMAIVTSLAAPIVVESLTRAQVKTQKTI